MFQYGPSDGFLATAGGGAPSRPRHWPLRRAALLAVVSAAVLVVLTACGGADDTPTAPGTSPGGGTSSPAGTDDGSDGGESVTVRHAQGTTEVPAAPEKVFVFDLGVMDTLNALGIVPAGVPEAPYPEELQEVAEAAEVRIGSLTEPDLEVIAEEDPDLIIVSASTAESYPELSGIAPTIDLSVDASTPMESFTAHVTSLAEVFGREAEAQDALDGIETKIEDARRTLQDAGNTDGLFVVTSGDDVTAFGPGSRFGWPHDVLGIPSASSMKAGGEEGAPASAETIAEADPENLFVIDADAALGRQGAAGEDVLEDELVQGTTAARNGKVIHLDPADWYLVGFGLDNLDRMINEVVNHVATESPTGGGRDVSDT